MSAFVSLVLNIKRKLTEPLGISAKGTRHLLIFWAILSPFAGVMAVIVFFAGNFLAAFIWFPSLCACLIGSSFFGLRAFGQGNVGRAKLLSRVPFFHPLLYIFVPLIFVSAFLMIGQAIETLSL